MKRIKLDTMLLNNNYGLSCVENYLLYVLKAENYPYKELYFKSFISLGDIAKAFIEDNATYAYFDKLERLQDIAKREKLIKLQLSNNLEDDNVLDNCDYCCVMVTPEYTRNKYKNIIWRDDHYILLTKNDNDSFGYINDKPRDIGVLPKEKLNEINGDKILAFTINKQISTDQSKKFLKFFIQSLGKNVPYYFCLINIITARDILGVLRISRRRVYEYSKLFTDSDFMISYLNILDKYYSTFEYMNVRQKIDPSYVNKVLQEIYIKDNEIIKKLQNKFSYRKEI